MELWRAPGDIYIYTYTFIHIESTNSICMNKHGYLPGHGGVFNSLIKFVAGHGRVFNSLIEFVAGHGSACNSLPRPATNFQITALQSLKLEQNSQKSNDY